MSSVTSSYASIPGPASKFFDIITASYTDTYVMSGDSIDVPIPFVVSNQVLEINVNQSPDALAFVNDGLEPLSNVTFQAKMMGGASLIKGFGPNMTTYLRNLINTIETLGSQYSGPLVLYVRPFMTKIQLPAPKQGALVFDEQTAYGVTTEPPTSTEYIGGGTSQNFYTAWVFKTPMTIQYTTASGNFKYITMTSQFSGD
jgi:hypothetical protein